MPAWLLPILITLLTDFLEWLFNQLQPTPPAQLGIYKDKFLAKVSWRIWYGKNRMAIAGQLFDKVAAKYQAESLVCSAMIDQSQCDQCAAYLCRDLTLN